MKTLRNNGTSDDNIVQNRFIAYLKISISRQKVKYLDKLFDQRKWELSFEEHEDTLNSLPSSGGAYFNKEVEDESLCRALNKLKDHERVIVFRRAVSEESFIKIAADIPGFFLAQLVSKSGRHFSGKLDRLFCRRIKPGR